MDGLISWSNDLSNDHHEGRARTLVITLESFGDAGAARHLIDTRFLEAMPNHRVATLDTDDIYDYGGQRPTILFQQDHFSDYDKPDISVHLVTDDDGTPFYLLRGPEPSFKWERVASAVVHMIDVLDVNEVIFLQSIPAPAPHTRPIFVSHFASRPELLGNLRGFPASARMSTPFNAMLTLRLREHGVDVVGLVAHVPHYTADRAYPQAAIELISMLDHHGIHADPSPELMQLAHETVVSIDQSLSEEPELIDVILDLEHHYDEFMGQRALDSVMTIDADHIGAEVEAFLQSIDTSSESAPGAEGAHDETPAGPEPTSEPGPTPGESAPARAEDTHTSDEPLTSTDTPARRGESSEQPRPYSPTDPRLWGE